ncbi:MAG: hypothetical protein LC721_00155 [Actinobacteria bacterium]|nr:hypothetical protein [Actinomycetota bacterium]
MSFEALLWATKSAPIADASEWAVLVAMAEAADDDGCNCYRSRTTIGSMVKLDPKTVGRRQAEMESRGLLKRGDQSVVNHIPADRRPVVWDLMIPYGWFPDIDKTNQARKSRGRQQLTPQDRPEIAQPAEDKGRKQRSDKGVPRLHSVEGIASPVDNGGTTSPGGTGDPKRGDLQSRTGGSRVPQPSPLTQSNDPVQETELALVHPAGSISKPKTTRKPSRVLIPEDWQLSDRLVQWAKVKTKAPGLDWLKQEAERFILDAHAEGRTHVNWDMAFQKWVQNELKWAAERGRVPTARPTANRQTFHGQGMFS